jgi:hypothetical protein
VGVIVQVNGQSSSSSANFTYSASTPKVSSISPNNGPTAGGTKVTITGTNFLAGALLLFGSTSATSVTVNSATQIQAVTPPNASGLATVTVENRGNLSANLASGFTYNGSQSGPPTISSVSPTSGAAGTQVTIAGTNFASADAVSFGSTNATPTTFVSATQLLATVPSISTGTYNLTVTNPDPASVTLNHGFTVTVAAPSESLLSGCTVNARNVPSCSAPSGWSLAVAQGFESGAVGPNEELQYSSISTSQAHTGTHAMVETISANGGNNQSPGGQWALNGAGVGCCARGEVYMSWWSYLDPTAKAQTESFFALMQVNNGTGQSQALIMDTQNPNGGLTTNPNLWFSPQTGDPTGVECSSSTDAPKPQNCSYYGPTWNLNLGTWEQEELWIHESTCNGGAPNNDGFIRFYINGQLRETVDSNTRNPWNGGNINGCVDMSVNTMLEVGGIWTYFNPGNPVTWNKYVDDIIVLKR